MSASEGLNVHSRASNSNGCVSNSANVAAEVKELRGLCSAGFSPCPEPPWQQRTNSLLSFPQMTTLEQVGEEVVGQARCPFESGQSNLGLFAGEWLNL